MARGKKKPVESRRENILRLAKQHRTYIKAFESSSTGVSASVRAEAMRIVHTYKYDKNELITGRELFTEDFTYFMDLHSTSSKQATKEAMIEREYIKPVPDQKNKYWVNRKPVEGITMVKKVDEEDKGDIL